MNINLKKILFIVVILSFVIPHITFAQEPGASPSTGSRTDTNPVVLPNPLGNTEADSNPNLIIGKAINGVLGIVGSLALVMFIYGGILWMTAAGNDQRVQKGKDTLLWAIIGLIFIFSSYAIINFVLTNVIGGQ